jgi:hypothetical protein
MTDMNNMGKVCEKIRQGLPVEVGALYAVTFYVLMSKVPSLLSWYLVTPTLTACPSTFNGRRADLLSNLMALRVPKWQHKSIFVKQLDVV